MTRSEFDQQVRELKNKNNNRQWRSICSRSWIRRWC